MKFFVVLLVACLTGLVYSADDGNANQFVDQIVTALKTQKGFDPLNVPEQHKDIDTKLGAIHIKGNVVLKNTIISGLSHIRRTGDAKLENKDGHFSAKLHLGDSNVKFHSDVTLNLGKILHPHLKIDADIGDIGVGFAVIIGSDGKPSIDNFHIDEFKHVKFHVHGLAILDPLVDLIADAFVEIANTQVKTMLDGLVKPIIESEIKNFKLGG